MRKSVLVLLLVATVLVAHTEAGWFRRAVNKVKGFVKKAVDKVKDFVKKHGPIISAVAGAIGKRSAQKRCPDVDEQAVAQLMQQLQDACPTFGIDADAGLNAEAVDYAFETSDADGNGSLNAEELEDFENIIDIYEECVNIAKRK